MRTPVRLEPVFAMFMNFNELYFRSADHFLDTYYFDRGSKDGGSVAACAEEQEVAMIVPAFQ